MTNLLKRIGSELGVTAIWSASSRARNDILLLYFIRMARLFGFGLSTSVLVLHAKYNLGWTDVYIGSFISVTLLGNALVALLVTRLLPYTGQRRMLSLGPFLMLLSGTAFYFSSDPKILLLAAVAGVISPIANEVSPYQAIDIAVLSQLVHQDARTHVFSSYMFSGAISSSIGGIVTGAVIHHYLPIVGASGAYRRVFLVFAAAGALAFLASLFISSKANLPSKESQTTKAVDENAPLLPDQPRTLPEAGQSKKEIALKARFGVPIAVVLSLVSGVDTFASAIASPSYISYDLNERFHPPIQTITSTLSLCGFLAGISFLFAGPLSRRLGILTTMFSSHIIAQVFLISYGLATKLELSVILILLRASFAVLELPPRTAFFTSIIKAEDRGRVLGYINLARTLTAAAGPYVDGYLSSKGVIWLAFVASGILKLIAYDGGLALFFAFRPRGNENVA